MMRHHVVPVLALTLGSALGLSACATETRLDPKVDLAYGWDKLQISDGEFREAENMTVEEVLTSYGPTSLTPESVECQWAVAVESQPYSVLDIDNQGSVGSAFSAQADEANPNFGAVYFVQMGSFESAEAASERVVQIVNSIGSCPQVEVAGDGYSSTYTYDSLTDHGTFATWFRSENARIGFGVFADGADVVLVRARDVVDDAQLVTDIQIMQQLSGS